MVAPLIAAGARIVAGGAARKTAGETIAKNGVKNATTVAANRNPIGNGTIAHNAPRSDTYARSAANIAMQPQSVQRITRAANAVNQNRSPRRKERTEEAQIMEEEAAEAAEVQAFLEQEALQQQALQQAASEAERIQLKRIVRARRQDHFARLRAARALASPWVLWALGIMFVMQVASFFIYWGIFRTLDTSLTDVFDDTSVSRVAAAKIAQNLAEKELLDIFVSFYSLAVLLGLLSLTLVYFLWLPRRHVRPLSGVRSSHKFLLFLAAIVGYFLPIHIFPWGVFWVIYVILRPA